jgi:site-specific recombinase XerD
MQLWSLVEEFILFTSFNSRSDFRYKSVMRTFISRSGVETLDQVNSQIINKFRDECLKRVKPITWNGYIRQLRIIFNFAVKSGYTDKNYFNKLQYVKCPKNIVNKTLSIEEIQLVEKGIQSFVDPRWFWDTIFQTFRFTGMRVRQLVNLRVSDLDFQQNLIFYSEAGSKNKKSWTIPMHSLLKPQLMRFLALVETNINRKLRRDDYVFAISLVSTRYKKYADSQTRTYQIGQYFKRLSDYIGFNVCPNRLRHTLATDLCNPVGGHPDLFAVQHILGHSRLEMTKNYVSPQMHRLAATIEGLAK